MDTQKRTAARGLALAVLITLAGCTPFVSQKPIFASVDFAGSDRVLGVYVPVKKHDGEYIIAREGEAGLRIVGLGKEEDGWKQSIYADGAAIPLGDGDYVLQLGCAVISDKEGWTPVPFSKTKGYADYVLALRDTRLGTFRLLLDFTDIDPALFAGYGVTAEAHAQGQQPDSFILPVAMTREKAIAFFREVAVDARTKGHGNPDIVEQTSVGSPRPDSDETKAIVMDSPAQCRAIVAQYKPDR